MRLLHGWARDNRQCSRERRRRECDHADCPANRRVMRSLSDYGAGNELIIGADT